MASSFLKILALLFIALTMHAYPENPENAKPPLDFARLLKSYRADSETVNLFYNLRGSEVCLSRQEKLQNEWQQRLLTVNFAQLNTQQQIQYLLLRQQISSCLSDIERSRALLQETASLLPFRQMIQDLEIAQWRKESFSNPLIASKISSLVETISKLKIPADADKKARASTPKIAPTTAKRAAEEVEALKLNLQSWFDFYNGYQPEFSWWMKKPHEEASTALQEYAKYLREEVAGIKGKDEDPLLGTPVGAPMIARLLDEEMIPYSAQELITIAEKELSWCVAERAKLTQEMGLGKDWKAAIEKIKSNYVPPGQQDIVVTETARAATQFVKDKHLLTIPPLCEETWRLTMTSPESQKNIPYAAYSGNQVTVAYAREEMKQEDKLMSMRGNSRHFMPNVIAHELIPGHHLQLFLAARLPQEVPFETIFFIEGWGLYCETLLWDHGYFKSPEDRLGSLFWRMHRCARVIVTLKYHLGLMKPTEMVDFLINHVGHERLGATSEVRRYLDSAPLYQCSYLIGALQLRALHQEIVGSGKMSDQLFHDTVLSYGAIPVELIRANMLNLPLTRETKASWLFYPLKK